MEPHLQTPKVSFERPSKFATPKEIYGSANAKRKEVLQAMAFEVVKPNPDGDSLEAVRAMLKCKGIRWVVRKVSQSISKCDASPGILIKQFLVASNNFVRFEKGSLEFPYACKSLGSNEPCKVCNKGKKRKNKLVFDLDMLRFKCN